MSRRVDSPGTFGDATTALAATHQEAAALMAGAELVGHDLLRLVRQLRLNDRDQHGRDPDENEDQRDLA